MKRRANDTVKETVKQRLFSDRGSSVVPFIILVPILMIAVELIVVGGRLAVTRGDVQSAAREAARQASLAAGPLTARNAIDHAVATALADKGFRCQSPSVRLGGNTDFRRDGRVETVVTCTVQLSDIGLLSTPGSVTVTATALEPIDRYRVIN